MAREKGMGNLQREKGGRWTMRVCIDGTRYCRSTRTKDRNKAEAFLQRFLAPFGLGDRTLPLADVWREYEKSPDRRELSPSTMNAKQVVWMVFAGWVEQNHLEVTQLKQLSRELVAEYLRVLRSRLCASTYNNRVCILREIFHVLADKAGVVEDPWVGVRLLPDDCHTRREFSVEELGRVLSAAKEMGQDWETLFLLGIYTGLRLGDCCTLEWSMIKKDHEIIQLIPRKTRKHAHGKPVTIPIHPVLSERLRSVMTRQDAESTVFVIPTLAEWYLGDERWRIGNGLEKIFQKACIKTSVKIEGRKTATPDATFHSLRHTFVSFSANAGVPLPVVQSIVGHTSSAMTRHYYHENEEQLRRAVAAIPVIGAGEGAGEVWKLGLAGNKGELGSDGGAAKASCSPGMRPPHGTTTTQKLADVESRLRKLMKLKGKGLISDDEYQRERRRILESI